MAKTEADLFQDVVDKAAFDKKRKEAVRLAQKEAAEREKFLRSRLIKKGPMTGSKGKKLKLSAKQGTRGLISLI